MIMEMIRRLSFFCFAFCALAWVARSLVLPSGGGIVPFLLALPPWASAILCVLALPFAAAIPLEPGGLPPAAALSVPYSWLAAVSRLAALFLSSSESLTRPVVPGIGATLPVPSIPDKEADLLPPLFSASRPYICGFPASRP